MLLPAASTSNRLAVLFVRVGGSGTSYLSVARAVHPVILLDSVHQEILREHDGWHPSHCSSSWIA